MASQVLALGLPCVPGKQRSSGFRSNGLSSLHHPLGGELLGSPGQPKRTIKGLLTGGGGEVEVLLCESLMEC